MRSGKPALLAVAACALLSMGCSSFFGHFTSHSITFHANDGSGAESAQTVGHNEDVKLAKNTFSRTGYSFLGWAPDSAASQPSYYDEAIYFVGVSDEDLYAIWAPAAACHTITFKAGAGTGSDGSQTVVQGSSANLRTVADLGFAAPAELTFGGWASSAEATVPEYSDGQSITMGNSDLVLYAVWGTKQLSVWMKGSYDSTFTEPSVSDGVYFGVVYSASPANVVVRLNNDGSLPLRISSASLTQGSGNPYAAFTLEGATDGIVLAAGKSAFLDIVLTGAAAYDAGGTSALAVDAVFKIKSDDQDEAADGYALNLSGYLGSP